MAKGGLHDEGWHAWQREACMVKGDVHGEGGMHGQGGCVLQGMCGRGCAWQGVVCMQER